LIQSHHLIEFSHWLHINQKPSRYLFRCLRVIILGLLVKLCDVRIGFLADSTLLSNYYYLNDGEPNTSTDCTSEDVNSNQQKYVDYEWKLTWNWFLITLLIPILGIICLLLIFSLDVDGYYSSTSTIDTLDEFMTIPDHDDGYHVNFAEALGYGFSVLANWISYIVAIAVINAVFFVIITWVLLRGTFSSFVIAGILGFVGFLLNAALLMAVLYKYQSDINMKVSESLVNEGLKDFRPQTERRTTRQQPIPELAIASIVEE